MSVNWANSIRDAIRERTVIQPDNMLVSRSQYGTRWTMMEEQKEIELEDTKTYAVRWYAYSETAGEWQIYLPFGCATINGRGYRVENEKAKDEDGNVILSWYHLDEPEDADGDVQEADGYEARQFVASLHMMPYERMLASFRQKETDKYKRVQWIESVAYVSEAKFSDGEVFRNSKVMDTAETRTAKELKDTGAFGLAYELQDPSDLGSDVKVLVKCGSVMLGSVEWNMGQDFDATGAKSVWLKVTHSSDVFSAELVKDLSNDGAVSDDDYTFVKLYEFKDGENIVTADLRDHLGNLQFYTYETENV